jgi:hypothetical protein
MYVKTLMGKTVTVTAPEIRTIAELKRYLCKQENINRGLWQHTGVFWEDQQCAETDPLDPGAFYHMTLLLRGSVFDEDVIVISDEEEEDRSLRAHLIDYFDQPGKTVATLLTRLTDAFKGKPKSLVQLKAYLVKSTAPECVGATDDDDHSDEQADLQQVDALLRRCATEGVTKALITEYLQPLLDEGEEEDEGDEGEEEDEEDEGEKTTPVAKRVKRC